MSKRAKNVPDTPIGAYRMHCMNYDLEPNYIKALNVSACDRKLAVLRFDHSIEIWNLNYVPVIEQVIYNGTLSELETIAWFERRLFATTLSGQLLEYDLSRSTIKYKELLTAGPAWCLDFHRLAVVAVGTDKGYINLFKVDENRLSFQKLLDKQDGPILALKFDHECTRIVTGGVNALRIWSIETGHVLNRINHSHLAPKNETHIWSLCVCRDFTIVTGDSHGYLTEWDGRTCVQLASHKTHTADITVLVLNDDENQLYCSGVDPTIVTFSRTELAATAHHRKRWVKSYQRQVHDRDVRGLALLGDRLYSGGYEACLTCSYGPPQTVVHYPIMFNTTTSLTLSANATMLLLKYSNYLEFWTKVASSTTYTKVHSVRAKSDEVIINAAISPDANWLTYATISHFRLFSINYDETKTVVTLTRKRDLPEICTSYKQAVFTSDSKCLIIAPFRSTNPVAIMLTENDFGRCHEILIDKKVQDDFITFLKVSACNQYLVIATKNCLVLVFRLKPELELYDILPKYSLVNVLITAVAIQPHTNNILIAHSNHKIIEYSIVDRQFTKFCEHSTPELLTTRDFNGTHPILNFVFHPKASNNFFFYNDSSICIVTKNQIDFNQKLNKTKHDNKKIKLADSNQPVFNVLNKYKHLVHFDYLTENEFVLLEIQSVELLKKLEKPYRKNQFGTK